MKQQMRQWPAMFSAALFALMLGCLLWLTVAGCNIYAAIDVSRAQNNSTRAELSYLQARLSAADEAGAVRVVQGPEGDALILGEPLSNTGFETRIYLWQGNLMEEYVAVDSAFSPEKAQSVAATETFLVERTGGLFTLATDAGQVKVWLHSGEGAQ